ncbi:MFS transporter [Lentibacter sp. XHP0401]|jgi:MFS family permease|uniref:MFS transporter n=1 Tax=Lentibacter sp. XHP0401 TaxID=2984334 RepID=UPI0021E6D861|nr:MFS transporter [Lentibacter sp. XHP0401]MCV2893840.1 MFS transporter [Lentibacter sp. XHP0401]
MRVDLILLCFAYVLSQFYRAFLAVLTEVLERDVGATPEDLAMASGLWFLAFAAMQIPVGAALDRVGPRRTASVLLLVGGGGGAVVFAMATVPAHISIAMLLIGVGCSPVLMASYYIFARTYSAAVFATLAAVILGVGSVGNLASALPTTLAVEAFGWRSVVWFTAGVSVITALGLFFIVRDPERVVSDVKGSVLDLLRMPALWLIFPLMAFQYAPAAGARGLWIGPYLRDIFGADNALVGQITLLMGAAMIAGTFAYGPLDRLLGTRKWVIFGGNILSMAACFWLGLTSVESLWLAVALFGAIGFFGASFPMMMAHGRAFYPPHLVGRGVTLMNLFAIGGVGIMQMLAGGLYGRVAAHAVSPAEPYQALFVFYGALVALGLVIYLFARERTD